MCEGQASKAVVVLVMSYKSQLNYFHNEFTWGMLHI